jgi:ubiquitin thioesterase protein OTUB1
VGDVNKFGDEEARLNSMGNMLDHIGYSRDIWIDFADGAFELLRKLADSLQRMDGAAADILLQTFNDMNESMSIITYVKVRLARFPSLMPHWLIRTAACQCLGADACR